MNLKFIKRSKYEKVQARFSQANTPDPGLKLQVPKLYFP